MPSFDTVSEVDAVEVKNSVDNSNRELTTRFDFRGVEASFELNDMVVVLKAEADFQLKQMEDMLRGNMAKRGVEGACLDVEEEAVHSGKTFSRRITFRQGIDQPMAKKIVKLLKDSKMKVQASIQGDKVRVNGKKRDDLQAAMKLMKEAELGLPLQFNNFRD